ncbi:MAG: NAD(P)-dependent alcohol dehydrogenase [Actinomycetia bacterium]|nr:NAD(P)-dependent alcohol dehydrogenase [Actinomycetes bacterium]
MKAIVRTKYGSPEVLSLEEIETPTLTDDGVLVRVHATSVNPAEWYGMMGTPLIARMAFGLRKPKTKTMGVDFAGTVAEVGKNVTRFHVGDEVFGGRDGVFAEYVVVGEAKAVLPKPANVTMEQAGSVAIAAFTALQGLRDKGKLQSGQQVLINGASGGVGTFAVQIAKWLGAEVTAVCSTRNVEHVRALGADHVIDYKRDDFTRSDRRYDLILDVAGSRSWRECRRILNKKARLVIVGAPKGNRLLGPVSHMLKTRLASVGSRRKLVFFVAKIQKEDLAVLADLMATGSVTPVIDRTYTLADAADAMRYLGEGHAQGKIVLTI